MPRLLPVLALGAIALALAGCGAGVVPAVHSEQERLALARRALDHREYNVAIELLKGYVSNNQGGADVDQAVEMLGESYLHVKEWVSAQDQFERLLRDYPESDSAGAASFHLGEALWGQSRGPDFDQENTAKALDQWQTYLRAYPGHWLNAEGERRVKDARERLARKFADDGTLYLKLRSLGPARLYFQRVLDDYGETSYAPAARYGLALADARDPARQARGLDELKASEKELAGTRLGEQAARERGRLERRLAKKR